MSTATDANYMAQALALARLGWYTTAPNPRVGCVLVKDHQIIAEGWHQWAGQAHAEVAALSVLSDPKAANGATAYVSLEPCSHHGRTGPCSQALIAAGVSRVVIAMQDPNPLVAGNGIKQLRDAGVQVDCGLLQADAEQLNRGFIKRMTRGLPYIRSKLAMSLDGRTALASGESQWITSSESRQDVQRFRAQAGAIVTGIDTVLADDCALTARVDFAHKPPLRVVLDSRLRMPLDAKMLQLPGETWVLTVVDQPQQQQRLQAAGAKVQQVAAKNGRIDLLQAVKWLAQQQVNEVWVEAGATLNGALLDTNLVDEWLIYTAPCVLGNTARALFQMPGLGSMADKKQFKFSEVRQIGTDLRLRCTIPNQKDE